MSAAQGIKKHKGKGIRPKYGTKPILSGLIKFTPANKDINQMELDCDSNLLMPLAKGRKIEDLRVLWKRQMSEYPVLQKDLTNVLSLMEGGLQYAEEPLVRSDYRRDETETIFNTFIENVVSEERPEPEPGGVSVSGGAHSTTKRKREQAEQCARTVEWNSIKAFSVKIPLEHVGEPYKGMFYTSEPRESLKENHTILLLTSEEKESTQQLVHFARLEKEVLDEKVCNMVYFSSPSLSWINDTLRPRLDLVAAGQKYDRVITSNPVMLCEVHIPEDSTTCILQDFFCYYADNSTEDKIMIESLQYYLKQYKRTLPGVMFQRMMNDLEELGSNIWTIEVDNDSWTSKDLQWDSNVLKQYANWLIVLITNRTNNPPVDDTTFLTRITTDIFLCTIYNELPAWAEQKGQSIQLWKLLKRCFRGLALGLSRDSMLAMLERVKKDGYYGQFNVAEKEPREIADVVTLAASFTDMTLE